MFAFYYDKIPQSDAVGKTTVCQQKVVPLSFVAGTFKDPTLTCLPDSGLTSAEM